MTAVAVAATDSKRVVVVGAGLAGLRVVEQLRRRGFAGALCLVGGEKRPPYDRPPLTKAVLRGQMDDTTLNHDLASLSLDLRLGVRVESVDPVARTVLLADGDTVAYDVLVLAPGAVPKMPRDIRVRPGVHVLRTHDDALGLRSALGRSSSVVVVGAGFIGCEVAASARELGAEVDLVEMLPLPLVRALGEMAAREIADLHAEHGVRLHLEVGVKAVLGADQVTGVELVDGTVLECSDVVFGLGVAPDIGWLASSGIAVDDGILCDERGRTSLPDVYAVGDAAQWWQPLAGRQRRVEHWMSAFDQAASVGAMIIGDDSVAPQPVPYFWSDQYDLKIQALGFVDASDDVTEVNPAGRMVLLYSRAGMLTAVVGFSAPKAVMSMRSLISSGAPLSAAIDQLTD